MRTETELFTSILAEPGSIDLVAPIVRVEDFLLDEHRALYQAMLDLIEQGQPITPAHITEKLCMRGWSADRAALMITREMDGAPLPGHAKAYAVMVHESARKRRIVGACESLLSQAQEVGANPNQLIEVFQERIFELQSDKPEMEIAPAREAAVSFLEIAHRERQYSGDLAGQPTGIEALDLATTGMRPGELWGVGALPGRGKTSIALQFAKASAERGDSVLFFSMEMAKEELIRRLIGERFGAWNLRNVQSMSDANWSQVREYAVEIAKWPLFIDDSARLYAVDIAARARLGIRQRKAKLIIVDYLQLIRGKEKELRERVGNAANVLRALAKETKVPVVLLSQLRRPGDINARPTMLDFKECVTGESLITMADGSRKSIKELEHGDVIQTWYEDMGIFGTGEVTNKWNRGTKHTWAVETRYGRRLTATANHPFYTPGGWKSLEQLKNGTLIAATNELQWDEVKSIKSAGNHETWDIEVSGGHSFIANNLLVHNSGDIEAHINTGLLLYMPIADDGRFTGEEEIIIGKQRWGPIGSVPVYYDTRSLFFKPRSTRTVA